MFPFHTWLPDAHVEAPTAGSVILAAIMLKFGTYGFLRFALPFFPAVAMHPTVRTAIIVLAVIGVIYGSLVALVQPDIKKLVAYSSVAHLGLVMLGIFALTAESVQGALMVMIGHGLSTGALFLLVGIIYERRHTRLIDDYGGIAKVVPMFAVVLTIVALSSIGLPGHQRLRGRVPRADRVVQDVRRAQRPSRRWASSSRRRTCSGRSSGSCTTRSTSRENASAPGPQPARARAARAHSRRHHLVGRLSQAGARRMEASARNLVQRSEPKRGASDARRSIGAEAR